MRDKCKLSPPTQLKALLSFSAYCKNTDELVEQILLGDTRLLSRKMPYLQKYPIALQSYTVQGTRAATEFKAGNL